MRTKNDEELFRLVKVKNRNALEELYDRYGKLVYSYAYKFSNNQMEMSKEITQLVYLRLWTTQGHYTASKGKFINWLLTITRNICLDYVKKELRHKFMSDDATIEYIADPKNKIDEHIDAQLIQNAKLKLSEKQRRLIDLLYWKGCTLQEIAKIEQEPLGTVKSRLHQSLKQLRLNIERGGATMKNDHKNLGEKNSLSDYSLLSDLIGPDDEMWEAMHFDFEVVEEPIGLKEEVLHFVLENENGNVTPWGKVKSLFQLVRNQFTPLTTSLSAAMVLSIVLLITPLIQGPSIEGFSEISATMKLNVAEGENGEVYGQAFLINKSGKEELVVNVFDFPQTKGQEVYQVWLIDNGQRQSAGVFRPDKEGYGVLTVDLSKLNSFDTIGITLEPNTKSKQPRGKKIVGT